MPGPTCALLVYLALGLGPPLRRPPSFSALLNIPAVGNTQLWSPHYSLRSIAHSPYPFPHTLGLLQRNSRSFTLNWETVFSRSSWVWLALAGEALGAQGPALILRLGGHLPAGRLSWCGPIRNGKPEPNPLVPAPAQ